MASQQSVADVTAPRTPHVPSPLGRLADHKLLLGLFLPMQEGAWSPSKAPRSTSWTFDYIARCTTMAEALGFDLAFGLAQWLGKGGYGGEMHFREHEVDPIIANAALASLTRSIVLINTVHVLYAWHPLHLAKFGAALDHISGGRWGINIVTGYKPSEYRMFGLEPIEHDLRYVMADEFTTIMERLWTEDEELTFDGRFWKTERAFLAPKPGQRRPFLVNAASSGAGLEYAAKHWTGNWYRSLVLLILFVRLPGPAPDFVLDEDVRFGRRPAVRLDIERAEALLHLFWHLDRLDGRFGDLIPQLRLDLGGPTIAYQAPETRPGSPASALVGTWASRRSALCRAPPIP